MYVPPSCGSVCSWMAVLMGARGNPKMDQILDEDTTFKFKHKIPLKKCFLRDLEDKNAILRGFQIETADKRVFTFSAHSPEEKESWQVPDAL